MGHVYHGTRVYHGKVMSQLTRVRPLHSVPVVPGTMVPVLLWYCNCMLCNTNGTRVPATRVRTSGTYVPGHAIACYGIAIVHVYHGTMVLPSPAMVLQ